MKTIRTSVSAISMSIVVGLAWAGIGDAASYRVTVESPPVLSDPLAAIPLDFGTKVSSVDRVRVLVSGIHSNGWWVGDGIENDYFGPLGASLSLYLLPGTDVHIAGFAPPGWYEGSVRLTNDGAFTASFGLSPTPRYLVVLPYVQDGRMALSCVQWSTFGWGYVARRPYLELRQVEIEMEASPLLEITSLSADGLLTWSALPPGGTVEILTATDPNGPWNVQVRLPSDSRSTILRPQAATNRFYRLRWEEAASL